MKINSSRTRLNCTSDNCRKSITVRKNTIFEGANIECRKIFHLGDLWLNEINVKAASNIINVTHKVF